MYSYHRQHKYPALVKVCLRLSLLVCVALFSTISSAADGFFVVAYKDSTLQSVTKEQLANVFLDKLGSIDGVDVEPIDIEAWTPVRLAFYQTVVKKDAAQLNAFWARRLFTGRGRPPRALINDRAVLQAIRANHNMIGYISRDVFDPAIVKVIYTSE